MNTESEQPAPAASQTVTPPDTSRRVQESGIPYRSFFWILVSLWTVAVAGSLLWNLSRHDREMERLTLQTARALFEKDIIYREWGTLHGGVYVPVTEQTQPNPHLQLTERDIVTPSGKALTLMNPAYMTRQVFELQNQNLGVHGHITSLKPIRPENAPDEWEQQALRKFEQGQSEITGVMKTNGHSHFRMMRPLIVSQGCLHCHSEQGYKVGDVRGGISLTLPMQQFSTPGYTQDLALAHAGLWLLGVVGLVMGARNIHRHNLARMQADAQRERLISELQQALANVKTLSGLVPICAMCKKIRDDQGYWNKLESYLHEHSHAEFTHGLCPECAQSYLKDIERMESLEADLRAAKPKPDAGPA